jgi:EAL domain-containing protein (putative c-di-GMP-specific phosphodiesterase class I)
MKMGIFRGTKMERVEPLSIQACKKCGMIINIPEEGYLFIKGHHESLAHHLKYWQISYMKDTHFAVPYTSKTQLLSIIRIFIERVGEPFPVQVSKARHARGHYYFPITYLYEQLRHGQVVQLIERQSFISFLQPIIHLKNEAIFGFESLLRSSDAAVQIPPSTLFETALKTGLHSLLDQQAREAAVKARVGRIPKGIKSFVNFLPSTIYNPDFCLKHTFMLMDEYGMCPDDFVFEVVETENIEDIDHLKKIFAAYKKKGIKVALDDVGAGFSTLDMLQKLQPDFVKIDRHYISHCDTDVSKQQFLSKVIHIANELNIQIVGEGIERREELDFCREIGLHYAQGYYIGKPSLHTDPSQETIG